jgi:two-component system, chemotaxis family, sensor kinase CheA
MADDQSLQHLRGQTIRVSAEKLDALSKLLQGIDKSNSDFDLRLAQVQSMLRQMRQQPLSETWMQVPRMVRDLAFDHGKKISFEMTGETIEVDRDILACLKNVVLHLIRNAIAHGLESPAERLAAGKDETGRLSLYAKCQSGHLIVSVRDDGRGLQRVRIVQKALDAHIIAETAAATMTVDQINDLIFSPGLSTADTLTEISGRGVGLGAVKHDIAQLGGTMSVASQPGQGTVFVITVPLA